MSIDSKLPAFGSSLFYSFILFPSTLFSYFCRGTSRRGIVNEALPKQNRRPNWTFIVIPILETTFPFITSVTDWRGSEVRSQRPTNHCWLVPFDSLPQKTALWRAARRGLRSQKTAVKISPHERRRRVCTATFYYTLWVKVCLRACL